MCAAALVIIISLIIIFISFFGWQRQGELGRMKKKVEDGALLIAVFISFPRVATVNRITVGFLCETKLPWKGVMR